MFSYMASFTSRSCSLTTVTCTARRVLSQIPPAVDRVGRSLAHLALSTRIVLDAVVIVLLIAGERSGAQRQERPATAAGRTPRARTICACSTRSKSALNDTASAVFPRSPYVAVKRRFTSVRNCAGD
jgi:hypothetical protein